jgi:CRP-like cAMP-binding protein
MTTATLPRGSRDLQLNLFETFTNHDKPRRERRAPPANVTPTSQEAAAWIAQRVAGAETRILQFLRSRAEGATNDALVEALAIQIQTVSPRVNSLASRGLVRDSGRKSLTRSGRPAIVWVAV